MRLLPSSEYGPAARITDADAFWILETLLTSGRTSRKDLSEMLYIGEGSIRKTISLLKECGLVEVYQTGMVLSNAGRELLDRIPVIPIDLRIKGSVVGEEQSAVVVKGVSKLIHNGQEQRDAGIRNGSLGCTTVLYRDGKLMIPPDWNLDEKSPQISNTIRKMRLFTEDDAIIIGGADSVRNAKNAAVSAALELI